MCLLALSSFNLTPRSLPEVAIANLSRAQLSKLHGFSQDSLLAAVIIPLIPIATNVVARKILRAELERVRLVRDFAHGARFEQRQRRKNG